MKMEYQSVFKRYELKYLLTRGQADELKRDMAGYMHGDEFGNSTICNIYYDTPDYLLIRRSLDKPVYKEKLRLRSYGVARSDSTVFPELKKKYQSVVYKRRLVMSEHEATDCLSGRSAFPDTQIGREIDYCFTRYGALKPKMFLSYEREAFYSDCDSAFRMTFDKNILWRTDGLSLCAGIYGNKLIGDDEVLLEVKTAFSMPFWLARFLSGNRIYRTSFSKYGGAYTAMTAEDGTGGLLYGNLQRAV